MRLWTLHPKYLDARGLAALWREGLLAQQVLRGKTRGYKRHPQLRRFRAARSPVGAIARYLTAVTREAAARGYTFDRTRIGRARFRGRLPATDGQLRYEWRRLRGKLRRRAPQAFRRIQSVADPEPHPLFRIVPGPVADWERAPKRRKTAARTRRPRRRH